ncbi:hypothetical protein KKD70_04285 [Patescibacteria group bacterium]|nr:hypothetical protein [Patescibacteria group bacterium]
MEEENIHNAFNKSIISWEAPEYIQHEKSWKWFFGAGLVVLLLCIYAIFSGNWTLALALVVFAAIYSWQHFETPKHVQVIVSRVGIKIGGKEYTYQHIKSFWIIYRPPHVKTLNLKSNSRYLPDIAIQLGDQSPVELREYLCSQLVEAEGKEESFVDGLIRTFKI